MPAIRSLERKLLAQARYPLPDVIAHALFLALLRLAKRPKQPGLAVAQAGDAGHKTGDNVAGDEIAARRGPD